MVTQEEVSLITNTFLDIIEQKMNVYRSSFTKIVVELATASVKHLMFHMNT